MSAGDSIPSRPVSCCSLCSRAMAHRVTVQPLTEKRKIPWRLLKIENQFCPLFPGPFPPRSRGEGELFLWGFAGGLRPPAKPPIFLPGAGEGAKATDYQGSSIAVELPDARLNNDRTFSSLNDVSQHLASPRKIESVPTCSGAHAHTFTLHYRIIPPRGESHTPGMSDYGESPRYRNFASGPPIAGGDLSAGFPSPAAL